MSKLTDDELAEMREKKVGFIFQSFNLLPRVSALENVALPLTYANHKWKDEKRRAERARELLSAVGLGHRLDFTPGKLSGGEKQRVAIARAMANDPDVIFADEPTGNLDSKSGQQVMLLLQKLNDEGRTIILVTHERYTAEHAGRIIQFKDGKIVGDFRVDNRHLAVNGEELRK